MSVAIPIPMLQHLPDVNVTPAVGVDEYALVYDHDTARFVLRAPFSGTPYALLAGRAGGQTLYGGTGANDDITIHGTSDPTRTTSYVILQPTAGNVGIGTSAPTGALHAKTTGSLTGTVIVERSSAGMADVPYGALRVKATKPTDMAAGFGVVAVFSVQDDAGVENYLAYIGAERAGADNTGDVVIQTHTAGTPTEKLRITSAGDTLIGKDTGTGNLLLGGSALRATTVGTKTLSLFNGIAPVGTLANGVSIYSAGGECYIMDAAGNATLQSPHDPDTGEWIFYSENTVTGRKVRVNMEQMVTAIEALTGQKFMEVTDEASKG